MYKFSPPVCPEGAEFTTELEHRVYINVEEAGFSLRRQEYQIIVYYKDPAHPNAKLVWEIMCCNNLADLKNYIRGRKNVKLTAKMLRETQPKIFGANEDR